MNLSGTLSNALSGLSAVSRIAETVSSNIANANTDGYGVRAVQLSNRTVAGHGSGVQVDGITRQTDPVLTGNRRLAGAELGQITARADFLAALERAIGLPDDPSSLSGQMSGFDAALIQAASRPDSEARLQAAVEAARSVATQLNSVSDQIQEQRMAADREIATSVDFINTSLQQIADLNGQMLRIGAGPNDGSPLADHRQRLIDGISELIPIREVPRDNGTIALFTPGGAILLDGTPAKLGFTNAGVIMPEMNIGAGTLSGLTINGKPVSTSVEKGPIAGGRLAGLFDVRDVQAPELQTRVDAVARDLVERFQDPAVDPTLGPGDPGLFTDAGGALVIADEVGLAGRISLNALVDPRDGGALWRLRDGLGAASPGADGDATLLNALSDALNSHRLPGSGGFIVPHSATGISADLLSGVSVSLFSLETRQSYARAHSEALIGMELENGVDTDAELQKLLLVEQAFAANARVISTVDELIQTLLRL
ncbi:MAG: flagellar hook-associated protein FlgK [Rhodobacter sp.]|nr:flagellar hook-associated protein FlgK [Rhodobacter sp.]